MTKHGKNIFDSDFESIVIGTFSHRNLVILMYSAPLRATRGHTQADTEDAKLWPAKEGEGE